MYEIEKGMIAYIDDIRYNFAKKINAVKKILDDISEDDQTFVNNYFKKNQYKLKSKSCINKYAKLFSVDMIRGVRRLNNIFSLTESDLKKADQEESLSKSDLLVKTKISEEYLAELYNDKFFAPLFKSEHFQGYINLIYEYIECGNELILYINRKLNIFVESMIKEHTKIQSKKELFEIVKSKDYKSEQMVKFLIEMHERRNVIEHHSSQINSVYINKSGSILTKTDDGSIIINSLHYVSDCFKNSIQFIITAVERLLFLENEKLDMQFILNYFKENQTIDDKFKFLKSFNVLCNNKN